MAADEPASARRSSGEEVPTSEIDAGECRP